MPFFVKSPHLEKMFELQPKIFSSSTKSIVQVFQDTSMVITQKFIIEVPKVCFRFHGIYNYLNDIRKHGWPLEFFLFGASTSFNDRLIIKRRTGLALGYRDARDFRKTFQMNNNFWSFRPKKVIFMRRTVFTAKILAHLDSEGFEFLFQLA